MPEENLFPSYIHRLEEEQIRREAAQLTPDGGSRAVLLYGPGGVGKTSLVRELHRTGATVAGTVWLDPVDIDDSQYWLLSNLERHIAGQLDPESKYFGPYLTHLSRLPSYTRPRVGHETVVSHLGRIKQIFAECYTEFTSQTGQTVVLTFDTIEIIRNMSLLVTLTQWIKGLPATLFVLAGRPPSGGRADPIRSELTDPYKSIPVVTIRLAEFTYDAAREYLDRSGVGSSLSDAEKAKLARLTGGHPLWLAFTVAYLDDQGLPEEAEADLADIEADLPSTGTPTPAGEHRQEAFKRRLVTPYQGTDFWHEAVKRLAVARESVDESIWVQLMADRPQPDDLSDRDQAWGRLLNTPWIRPRANGRSVTLHDAVAEELAQRIIPLHDQDKSWRCDLWQRAVSIYGQLIEEREAELAGRQGELDELLDRWDALQRPGHREEAPSAEEADYIRQVDQLEGRKRELAQLKAVRLYYELLSDAPAGCQRFLDLFATAKDDHDVLFQSLLAFEIQRFLPDGGHGHAFGDVIGEVIDEFQRWLAAGGQREYLDIGLSLADYLVRDEQPSAAEELLKKLPDPHPDHHQAYRLYVLRGNACMRIPGQVRRAPDHFQAALASASAVTSPDRARLVASANKELGFYYRNEGLWVEADEAYRRARDAISQTLSAGSAESEREEMASIQTNWAYVKGLTGAYREGTNLVESAIKVRHRLGNYPEEGISWSVCGEVYRYSRRFRKAWTAYAEAEHIFDGQRNWAWLGLIYQEQAICLFQATQDGIALMAGQDPVELAKQLIVKALDLCGDLAVRGQPSALNRAGRIFGAEDPDQGLEYLDEGITWARRLSDGWFWFANLIEYVELCYRTWVATGEPRYFDQISDRAPEITEIMGQYEFPDLRGRWNLLQGHLDIRDWLETEDASRLDSAQERYKTGFAQIAQGYVGSSGAAAIGGEFDTFGELVWQLPEQTRATWQAEFRRAWSDHGPGSTLLLARLEELY
jgi:ABC-type cobalamin/Fe3+-siderophores transport system ATPase subunit/tetratricopeptide (TPR) repeat protein